MSNTYLSRTSGTATNTDKCTLSVWIKRSKLSGNDEIIIGEYTDGNNRAKLLFNADQLHYFQKTGGSTTADVKTTRVFRDPSAWYHIVVAFDTTQSTNTDRIKFYINGVQETAFDNTTYPSSGQNIRINESSITQLIGYAGTTNTYFDGSMSHIHFTDGYAYAASTFGETDSTTGEWKINTAPSLTYGNNGFFILKDGNSVTDQSGNSNNFTVASGTLTKTEDCPSNVFATINVLGRNAVGYTIENGNLSTNGNASNAWRGLYGTLAASSGKFYYECKIATAYNNTGNGFEIGVADVDGMLNSGRISDAVRGYGYQQGSSLRNNGSTTSYGSRINIGEIVGVAVDLDNSKLYFHRNGTYEDSGDPTSGSTGTGAISIASGYAYVPAFSTYYSADDLQLNFGNGYFGTTAVSSAGTNASGNGIFEYDCPSGYTAFSTKGLNL